VKFEGERISAIINESLANRFGLETGDTVLLETPTGELLRKVVGVLVGSSNRQGTVSSTAAIPTCEMDSRGETGIVYWEGPVTVEGTARGEGYGYFTGYEESLENRF
jgi:anaerobic selenocysteine-containing dehydrogenase